MNSITNSLMVLFIAFFFAKTEGTEWYWWAALVLLFLLDEYRDWGKKRI